MNRFAHLKSLTSFLFFLLLSVLISAELIASHLAYENYGGITDALLFLAVFLNIIPVVFIFSDYKKTAVVLISVIGLLIIPLQAVTFNKLTKQKEESAGIVNFVYRERIANGRFPNDLSGYKFIHPELAEKYKYEKFRDDSGQDDFQLTYSTGTRNTSHFYNHSRGPKWMYCDD